MTPAATLRAAADLIERTGWTQGALARSAKRRPVSIRSPKASCFCAEGALDRIGPPGVALTALCKLGTAVRDGVADWNDAPDQTAENVVATMRRVAAEIEGSEGR